MNAANGTLKLDSLYVTYNTYGHNEGRYTGTVKYQNSRGSVELALDPVLSERLLSAIGPAITEASSRVAHELERSIGHSLAEMNQPVIEDRKEGAQ